MPTDIAIELGDQPKTKEPRKSSKNDLGYRIFKRLFDLVLSIFVLLPILAIVCVALVILNPIFNRGGRLFYKQERMGFQCRPFITYKLRSMVDAEAGAKRTANCPLEKDRITPLGAFLRKSRLDELPQIWNVVKGEMSLIGPRPDQYDHALEYREEIDGYADRHAVKPGISGLAQIKVGYVESTEATRRKVSMDAYYIAHRNIRMELSIFWQTIWVMLRRAGS